MSGPASLITGFLSLWVAVDGASPSPSLSQAHEKEHKLYHDDPTQPHQTQPQEIAIGQCSLHLWPRDDVWTVHEGDVMQVIAQGTESCRDTVTLTMQEVDGSRVRSEEMVRLRSTERVAWILGRALPSHHGLMLELRIADPKHETIINKLLNVEFKPKITMLTPMPYQGNSFFVYFLYLCVWRQKELVTGASIEGKLGWDVGDSTTLRVKVEGNPEPRVVWRVGKQDITPGETFGTHYVTANETRISSTESVYKIDLVYLTLKMAQEPVRLIARNKLSQQELSVNLPVNMFPITEQRSMADAVTRSFGLVLLIFTAMALFRITNRVCIYVSRIAETKWDGITCHLLTCLVPVRTLRKVFRVFCGLGISLGLLTFFGMESKVLVLPRVLLHSLFIIFFTYLFGRYKRVRAAFWLVLAGMLSRTGLFLLLISTSEVVLHASQAITKNVIDTSLQVQCVSQIHRELFRESVLAYLQPVRKRESDYAHVQLVKERDMALAQESMKISADISLNDVHGEKLGEQKEAEMKNRVADRAYNVHRFAKIKKKAEGGRTEKAKFRKKYVFKSLNMCQDIGSNVLMQCVGSKYVTLHKCLKKFPGVTKWLGRKICSLFVKHVDCQEMYRSTVRSFKCDSPGDAKEVAEGLLLLREGPAMFYGDASPQDLHQMYSKELTIQFAPDKPRESKEATLQQMEDAKSMMSTVYIVAMIALVLYSTNRVLSDMISYDKNIKWQNVYIGSYFRKIDRKRGVLGFPKLLPLKRVERQRYIEDVFATKAREEEKDEARLKSVICLGVQVLTALMFLVEYLVFTVTIYEVVRENTTYSIEIDDYLQVSARGDSFFALLINLVFENINMDNHVIKYYRVDRCNPKVTYPNLELYARQEAIILFLFLLIFVLPGPDRLKHLIFSLYYPKREKKRQIKLYTTILLTRKSFIDEALRKLFWSRIHGKMTMLHDPQWQDLLLRQFRGLGFLLRLFISNTCSICETTGRDKYVVCRGPGCTMIYCRQCWAILGEKCLSCNLVLTKELKDRLFPGGEGLLEEEEDT